MIKRVAVRGLGVTALAAYTSGVSLATGHPWWITGWLAGSMVVLMLFSVGVFGEGRNSA